MPSRVATAIVTPVSRYGTEKLLGTNRTEQKLLLGVLSRDRQRIGRDASPVTYEYIVLYIYE